MNIIYLDRARFLVESESDPGSFYLADMLEHRRQGWCGCIDFAVNVQKPMDDGHKPARTRCKHLRGVRSYIAREIERKSRRRISGEERTRCIDRVLFRIQRIEVNAQNHPQRYGTR